MQCNETYAVEDMIPILPTSQKDKDRLELRIKKLQEQGLTHSLKKASGGGKKRKKHANVEDAKVAEDSPPTNASQPNTAITKPESNIKNTETASLTAKVLAEQEDRNKRRRLGANDNVKSLFSSKNGSDGHQTDFMTRGFSIPTDARQ